jgi:hypothetical protein
MLLKRLAVALGLALLLGGSAALLLAPYLMTELHFFSPHYDIVAASAPALAKGHMVDDYWAVQERVPQHRLFPAHFSDQRANDAGHWISLEQPVEVRV